ncbi:hypothetical protein [Sedimentibacter sp.]|uniref:hypothetical protein n=1 Tax=Sedimentibacter sp. TaxID=1960295 RepID=UPI000EEC30B3|nr:hypothetical protein [Sedimentibacter sp.]HCX61316.1 hypothetical protein [Clostridiales bacterium]
MKQPRNVLKSIRITQELHDEIQKYEGSTWNDKVNNMLDFYVIHHKQYLEYLNKLEAQIQEKEQLLNEFKLKISKFQDLLK